MKRIIRVAATAAVLVSGLGSVGCMGTRESTLGDCYRKWCDPCYPERYNHAARQAVVAPFAQQVHNGHVLDQTLWNYHFETGTDKLNAGGMEKLDSIARTRPTPDSKLYIQAARDFAPSPDKMAAATRDELNTRRAAAIQRHMATQPMPVPYEIFVHDPSVPGIRADFGGSAYTGSAQGYAGGLGAGRAAAAATGGGTNITIGGSGANISSPPPSAPR
jgi:hypothetical protein